MKKYIGTRLIESLAAILVITILVFALTHMSGSPVDALLPQDATQDQIDALVAQWGLDQPLAVQYLTFLKNALAGDFGDSLKWRGYSAMGVVLDRFPQTLLLGGVAVAISVIVAIPLGVMAAMNRNGPLDRGAQIFSLFGQSVPQFWFAILLIWFLAVALQLVPTSGSGSWRHLILPAIAMAWFQIAALSRLTRSAMLDVLDAEYIKLARVKGVREARVVWVHALRNAAVVPLTYFGVLAGSVLTGSVTIETVFSWPGLGWVAIEAIRARDFPVVQAVVVIFAIIYIVSNFLVDILNAYIDPRVRS
ncbi:ABC transporter permease [Alloyangia pacifica]|uniref:ABC transporter permease n=1 Tax=Alloyangia pacifica TaxID=311180 RepID=UPI001CFD8742|nr:ABC transporter permease [Alloyangia pacifica]